MGFETYKLAHDTLTAMQNRSDTDDGDLDTSHTKRTMIKKGINIIKNADIMPSWRNEIENATDVSSDMILELW